jgi:hypothetical protein
VRCGAVRCKSGGSQRLTATDGGGLAVRLSRSSFQFQSQSQSQSQFQFQFQLLAGECRKGFMCGEVKAQELSSTLYILST